MVVLIVEIVMEVMVVGLCGCLFCEYTFNFVFILWPFFTATQETPRLKQSSCPSPVE